MANKFLGRKLMADILLGLGVALVVSGLFLAYFPFQKPAVTKSRWQRNNETNDNDVDDRLDLSSNRAVDFNLVSPLAGKKIEIEIQEGSTTLEVARVLDRNGLLSADEFLKLVSLFGLEKRVKSGHYIFGTDADVSEILAKIIIRGGD